MILHLPVPTSNFTFHNLVNHRASSLPVQQLELYNVLYKHSRSVRAEVILSLLERIKKATVAYICRNNLMRTF